MNKIKILSKTFLLSSFMILSFKIGKNIFNTRVEYNKLKFINLDKK